MDTDILILQLRQSGINIPSEVGQIAFIDTDGLYGILRQAIPLCGFATEGAIKKQFPAKLPNASPSARYYVLNSLDGILKSSGSGGAIAKGDDDDTDGGSACPTNTEALMYPTEPTTRALLSWVVSTIASRQEKVAAAAAADRRTEADEELVGVAPSIHRLLKGSLLLLRSKVNDNAAVVNAKANSPLSFLATPVARASGSSTHTTTVPAMIPVAPTTGSSAVDTVASALNQLNRINKQANSMAGVPKLDPQRAKVYALSQSYVALQTAAAPKRSKKGAKKAVEAVPYQDSDAGQLQRQWLNNARNGSVLGSLFFDTDVDGLGANGGARARTQQRLEEASKAMTDLDEKAKNVALRGEEREAELQRVQEALAEAKKESKRLKQLLGASEESNAALNEELKAFSDSLAAKEESLQARRALLEELQTQLGWMEDYEGTVAQLEAQIAEAKALQKQVQEDLKQKLAKMETKKEELNTQVSQAGDGRQEQILAARQKVKKIKKEIRAKTKEIEELHNEYDRVPKDIDRSLFLRYIFDMTNNIQRQQAEVDKVKADIYKESVLIGEKTEALLNLFSSVEQEIYKKAVGGADGKGKPSPDDEFAKDAFKRIVAIREAYANLRTAIQVRGEVRHEVHVLDEKHSKAMRLGAAQDQKKVLADLEAVEIENEQLGLKLDEYLKTKEEGGGGEEAEEGDDDDAVVSDEAATPQPEGVADEE